MDEVHVNYKLFKRSFSTVVWAFQCLDFTEVKY